MKKQSPISKKPSTFILILTLSVIIISLFSILYNKTKSEIEAEDLPTSFDNKINALVINEVMPNNSGVYVNDKNKQADYVELYNGTDNDINLDGYGLSDRKDRIKWAFSNTIIKAHGYLVVSLTGELEDGLNAAFKLSSKGKENIILTKPNGKVIDAVETLSIGKNEVMARDQYGNWYVTSPTPGYENSSLGQSQYIDSLKAIDENNILVINELLPNNKGNFINEYGELVGFIEFKNIGDKTINLNSYTISDDYGIPFKLTLPDVLLKPNEVYAMYLGKADYNQENYLGFNVANKEGYLLISKSGKIIYEFDYDSLENGTALIRSDNGVYYKSGIVSYNQDNNSSGIDTFESQYLKTNTGLIINEVMSNNEAYLAQNGNKFYDWIELYNNSSEDINLSEYNLSTSDNNLDLYTLPNITLKAHEYYILMASGEEILSNQSYIHTNFKIGQSDGLFLSKDGKIVDCLYVYDVPLNKTISRGKEYGIYYTDPTPLKENDSGYLFISSEVIYSKMGGVYNDDSFYLTLSASGNIHYTLDGSTPTSTSLIYSEPIFINKTCVVKTINIQEGGRSSDLCYYSYIMNEYHTVPVCSVSIDPNEFELVNTNVWLQTSERQAYMEFYEESGSFKIPCSISPFGGNARSYPKKSYAIRFKNKYGASDLNYPLFDNRDNSSYDSIVLRSGSSDYEAAIIRDIFATSLVDDYTDVDVLAYKTCIVYINGQYWGIYNIREKSNAHLIEDHYNVSSDGLNFVSITGEVKAGSTDYYQSILEFVRTHDISLDENYDKLAEMVDMVNMIDYWIAESYTTNNDLFNVRFFNSPYIDDGKLKYIFFDLDYGLYWWVNDYYTQYLTAESFPVGRENDIIKNCFKNKKFKELWLERLNYNLHNTWNTEIVRNRFEEIVEMYKPEIERNQLRWGLTVKQWEESLDYLREFISNRNRYFLRQTKNFFNLTDQQMKEYFQDLW